MYYILKDKVPVPCDRDTWAKWYENGPMDRVIKFDCYENVEVSTVFLGLDYNFSNKNKPIEVFETKIFGGKHDEYMTRCATYYQALEMHQKACEIVFKEVQHATS